LFPRQIWDVDVLAAGMKAKAQFLTLAEYSERRYGEEEAQRGREPEPGCELLLVRSCRSDPAAVRVGVLSPSDALGIGVRVP
jgi:hypothetical protein